MTYGQDPVIHSNGYPMHQNSHPTAEPTADHSSAIEVRGTEHAARRRWRPRPHPGIRPSTMALVGVWIAVLALYLAVRPGG